MNDSYLITQDDIQPAVEALNLPSAKALADMLHVTYRSLIGNPGEPLSIPRQMSIECLLRRAGQWEQFCRLRTLSPEDRQRAKEAEGYRCIICSQCVTRLRIGDAPRKLGGR